MTSMTKAKTFKTLGGVIRHYDEQLMEMRGRYGKQGRPFDWTAAATPMAANLLRQLLEQDDIPSSNLLEWISETAATSPIGQERAGDLKKIASLLRGPRADWVVTTTTTTPTKWGTTIGGQRIEEHEEHEEHMEGPSDDRD